MLVRLVSLFLCFYHMLQQFLRQLTYSTKGTRINIENVCKDLVMSEVYIITLLIAYIINNLYKPANLHHYVVIDVLQVDIRHELQNDHNTWATNP